MPTLALTLAQTKYGTADAIASLVVAGVARPDVTIKAERGKGTQVETITGAWLPGSSVAVEMFLKNDLYDSKGDRNAYVLKVELDGVDQGIARDVLGAAVQRFSVTVPAAKPAPAPTTPAASGLTPADRAMLDALAAKVEVIRAQVDLMARRADAFYLLVEVVPELPAA